VWFKFNGHNMKNDTTPESVVQQQLDAFNARDIDAFAHDLRRRCAAFRAPIEVGGPRLG